MVHQLLPLPASSSSSTLTPPRCRHFLPSESGETSSWSPAQFSSDLTRARGISTGGPAPGPGSRSRGVGLWSRQTCPLTELALELAARSRLISPLTCTSLVRDGESVSKVRSGQVRSGRASRKRCRGPGRGGPGRGGGWIAFPLAPFPTGHSLAAPPRLLVHNGRLASRLARRIDGAIFKRFK